MIKKLVGASIIIFGTLQFSYAAPLDLADQYIASSTHWSQLAGPNTGTQYWCSSMRKAVAFGHKAVAAMMASRHDPRITHPDKLEEAIVHERQSAAYFESAYRKGRCK